MQAVEFSSKNGLTLIKKKKKKSFNFTVWVEK